MQNNNNTNLLIISMKEIMIKSTKIPKMAVYYKRNNLYDYRENRIQYCNLYNQNISKVPKSKESLIYLCIFMICKTH
jgi:hypothetical protein